MNNQLPYDEVVDTLADSIDIYREIKGPLSDGFQIPDLLAVYNVYPKTLEIYRDRQVFLTQLLDLTAEEAQLALNEIAKRTGTPRDNVERIAMQSFSIASRTYRLVRYNLVEVEAIRDEVQLLLKVDDGNPGGVFPIPA